MTTKTEEKKRLVKFKDEDGQSFIVTVEITHRNGYPEFSASGEYGGGCGQCDEHIKPKNEPQKKLIEIWNKWHLNNKKKKLPINFWEQLQVILNQIEETEEEEHKDEKNLSDFNFSQITEGTEESEIFVKFGDMHGNETGKVIALGISEDLTVEEALNEIEVSAHDDCFLEYAGCSYLVGDDEDMDIKWDEDLENYIDDCILHELPEQYRQYFDNEAWKDDARVDGRAHSLNRYDGGEESETIDGTEYFIYRQ